MLEKFERVLLISITLAILLLADAQILYRNISSSGVAGVDNILRIAVLWMSLAGAVLAVRYGSHVSIDLFKEHLDPKFTRILDWLVSIFSAIICAFVAWFSIELVQIEFQDGMTLLGIFPVWIFQVAIPLAFAVMSLRFALKPLAFRSKSTS